MSIYSEKPWLEKYKLGPFKLPVTMEPYPKGAMFEFLDATAKRFGARPACSYLGAKLTYAQLKNNVDSLAAALQSLGIMKGDRVATILPTCPQFVIADYAIQKAGAVHVPCSLLHTKHDLIWELGESGAKIVICLDSSLDLIMSLKPETNVEHVVVTSMLDFSASQCETKKISGALQLLDLIAQTKPTLTVVSIDPDEDLALLVFTGGATGRPKGVMLTHTNLLKNTVQGFPWAMFPLKDSIIGKSSVLIAVPVFHAYGHAFVRIAVYWGLQMLMIPDPRDIDSIAEHLKKSRPFIAAMVPTQYMKLTEKNVGRSNTAFLSGAAPLPPAVASRFKQNTGMPIIEGYGLTETSPVAYFNLSSFSKITGFMPFEKIGSIGVPVADTDVKIVDGITGKEVSQGDIGELYIKGPQVMKGYWPDSGQGLVEGWLPTGDLCKMDEDGYFFLVDRNKDMVNVSGNKVYTVVVDEVLFEHPAVAEAVTIGIPDPERPGSERVKAFVVPKAGIQVTEEEIINFCRERMAPYAVPKSVEFRDHLPMTVTNKIFKKKLRDEEIAKMKS